MMVFGISEGQVAVAVVKGETEKEKVQRTLNRFEINAKPAPSVASDSRIAALRF